MTFRTKLILLLLLVAVVPVALSGVLSIATSQKEMTAQIGEYQKRGAALTASAVDAFFVDAVNSLKLATGFIPFDQFPEAELSGALAIPYRQFDTVNIVALLDQQGRQLCDPAFEEHPEKMESLKNHEAVAAADVENFGANIPLQAALASKAAFGPVYLSGVNKSPRVALAIAFPVHNGQERWVLAVELSLRKVGELVSGAAPGQGGLAFLVDSRGNLVTHPDKARLAQRTSMAGLSIVSSGLKKRRSLSQLFSDSSGREYTGTFAPIPSVGWGLVIQQSVSEAFAVVNRIRVYALFWLALSLVVAMFGGLFFARGVSAPVRILADSAREIAKGKFDRQIEVRSKDELGELAVAFNQMATDLRRSFALINQKNREIQKWNQELQQRVEERTRELREAQDQIIQSQKLAAVSELGAGVAHEINNPLTGIQGFAQLLQVKIKPDDEKYRHLSSIIKETDRIRAIVDDMLRMSQSQQDRTHVRLKLDAVVEDALRMVAGQLAERNIEVKKNFAAELPPIMGHHTDLQQMFLHLISNARNAMPRGGTLHLEIKEIDGGAVKVAVRDNGVGIEKENLPKLFEPFFTTKQDWSGRGLGLSVANRIVQEHNGKISVESTPGKGTNFFLIFPGLRKTLHIR